MEGLSRLALSLCGLLAIDPPCRALKRGHNRGREVSCDTGWERYVRISHQGMSTLNSTLPQAPSLLLSSDDVQADLARAHAAVNGSFVWRFPYFHAAKEKIAIPPVRVEVAWASNLTHAARLVLRSLPRRFAALHLRRRDTVSIHCCADCHVLTLCCLSALYR